MRQRLRDGAKIGKVVFVENAEVLGEGSPETTRYLFQYRFKANGEHKIQARLELLDAEGKLIEEVLSNKIRVDIDDNLEAADIMAIADAGRNLLRTREVIASANSVHKGRPAKDAVDANGSSQWVSEANAETPTLTLKISPFAHATCLKLTPASPDAGDKMRWDRPKDIVITINRKKKIRITLPDLIDVKHVIEFKSTRVFLLKIKILSRYRGSGKNHYLGFREVELFKKP